MLDKCSASKSFPQLCSEEFDIVPLSTLGKYLSKGPGACDTRGIVSVVSDPQHAI